MWLITIEMFSGFNTVWQQLAHDNINCINLLLILITKDQCNADMLLVAELNEQNQWLTWTTEAQQTD